MGENRRFVVFHCHTELGQGPVGIEADTLAAVVVAGYRRAVVERSWAVEGEVVAIEGRLHSEAQQPPSAVVVAVKDWAVGLTFFQEGESK